MDDRDGKTIYRADRRDCADCSEGFSGEDGPDIRPRGEQLIDPITAYQIDTMLEGVVIRGTGGGGGVLGRPIGGKTGTTNDFRSAWFMGFSPQIVVGVFVGFDDNRSLGKGETGAVAALPIFIEFMQEAIKGLPPLEFKAPSNAKFAMVGPNREAFRPGTEPKPSAPPTGAAVDRGSDEPFAITPPPPRRPGRGRSTPTGRPPRRPGRPSRPTS